MTKLNATAGFGVAGTRRGGRRSTSIGRVSLLASTALVGMGVWSAPAAAQTVATPTGGGTITRGGGSAPTVNDQTANGGGIAISNVSQATSPTVTGVTIANSTGAPTSNALDIRGSTSGLNSTGVTLTGANQLTTNVSGGAALYVQTNANMGVGFASGGSVFTGSYGINLSAPAGYISFDSTGYSQAFVANGSAVAGINAISAINAGIQIGGSTISGFATGVNAQNFYGTGFVSTGGSISATTTGIRLDATGGNNSVDSQSAIVAPTGIWSTSAGGTGVTSISTSGAGTINGLTTGNGTGILASDSNALRISQGAAIGNTTRLAYGIDASTTGTGTIDITSSAAISVSGSGAGIRSATSGGANNVTTTAGGTIAGGAFGIVALGATGSSATTVTVGGAIGAGIRPATGVSVTGAGIAGDVVTINANISATGSALVTNSAFTTNIGSGVAVVGGGGSGAINIAAGGKVGNDGTITGYYGIFGNSLASLDVTNSGTISGTAYGVYGGAVSNTGVSRVTNTGTISASSGSAISFYNGGTVVNNAGGVINGGNDATSGYAIQMSNGTERIDNNGTITGGAAGAIYTANFGSFALNLNAGSTTTGAINISYSTAVENIAGTLNGALLIRGVIGQTTSGRDTLIVTSTGVINSSTYGVSTDRQLTLTNNGSIAGAGAGILSSAGLATIRNKGTISGASGGNGALDGVYIAGTANVINSGTISSVEYSGVVAAGGGTVINAAGGTLSGGFNSALGAAVQFSAAGGSFTNYGNASSAVGKGVYTGNDGPTTISLQAGSVTGDIATGSGNDTLAIYSGRGTGSTATVDLPSGITLQNAGALAAASFGAIDLGGGTNTLMLRGIGDDTAGNGAAGSFSLATSSGATVLTKADAGTWTLTGAAITPGLTINAGIGGVPGSGGLLIFNGTTGLTGAINVNGGTIRATTATAFGTGTIHTIDPTVQFGASGTYANAISLESTNPSTDPTNLQTFGTNITATLSGAITQAVAGQPVVFSSVDSAGVANAGTFVLTNTANAWTGSTTISAGTTLQGATNTISGSSVANAGTLLFSQNIDGSFAANISGAGTLQVNAPAQTVTLTGTNTNSGATNVLAGTLAVSGGNAIGNLSAVTVASGATLGLLNSETIGGLSGAGNVTVAANTLTLGGNNASTTFSGGIIDTTPVSYVGSWVVSDGPAWSTNPPTYTGQDAAALLFGGTASNYRLSTAGTGTGTIDDLAWYNRYGSTYIMAAANYRVDTNGAGYNSQGDTSAYVQDHNDSTKINYAFIGGVHQGGGLTKTGTGTLTLTGTNTYIGLTSIIGGTLAVSGGSAIADAGSVDVGAAGTFAVLASETINTLTGSGATTIVGGAALTLANGSGSYTGNATGGGLVLAGGSWSFGGTRSGADSSAITVSGANSALTVASTGSIQGGQYLGVRINGTGNTLINLGSISNTGTGGDAAYGAGVGIASTSGTTTITNGSATNSVATIGGQNGGINHLASGGVVATGLLTVNNYGLIYGTSYNGIENQNGSGALTVTNYASGRITGGNAISSNGALTLVNAGTISGQTTGIFVAGGATTITNSGTISGGSNAILLSGNFADTVTLNAGSVITGAIALGDGNDILNFNGGTIGLIDGGAGSDTLNVTAAAPLTLNIANVTGFETQNLLAGTLTLIGTNTASAGWTLAGATTLNVGAVGQAATLTSPGATAVTVNNANSTVNIASGSTLTGGIFTIGGSGTGALVHNDGTLNSSATGAAVNLTGANARLENTGTITVANPAANFSIVYMTGANDVVVNSGTITGSTTGTAFNGAVALVGANASITNLAGALITGQRGITTSSTGANVVNAGTVTGTVDNGISLFQGGSATNSGTITANGGNDAWGIFSGGAGAATIGNSGTITGGSGIWVQANATFGVTNSGTITGVQYGVNAAAGTLNLTNTNAISGTQFAGVGMAGGGTLTNSGAITGGTDTAGGLGYGVIASGAANATITNQSGGAIRKSAAGGLGAILASTSGAVTIDLRSGSSVNGDIVSTGAGTRNVSVAGTLAGAYNATSGTGVDTLTLANTGTMTSANLGAGDDTFLYQGGTFSGQIDGGAGTDAFVASFTGARTVNISNVLNFESYALQAGTLTLTGTSGVTGPTAVNGGTLAVNGNFQSATSVGNGAALTGAGTVGAVTIADGGSLNGVQGATLSIASLNLSSGSIINATFGAAGGNALFSVAGDLTLDGTVNIADTGAYGFGVYRLINYGGALTDNGLVIGTTPTGAQRNIVQTSVQGQVNVINAPTELLFWDGGNAALANNGSVDGGSGIWSATAPNWTDSAGLYNAAMTPQPGFAIFEAAGGAVTVDGGAGPISVTGMQFASDGYVLSGDPIGLAASTTVIRVGDGSTAGADYVATINSALTGTAGLQKTDLGTLILTGTNSWTGVTTISDGTLQGTTASISGSSIALNGTLIYAQDTNGTAAQDIAGSGTLIKQGSGTVTLSGDNGYTGGTSVQAGTLVSLNRGNGFGVGTVDISSGATAQYDNQTGGALFIAGNTLFTGAGTLLFTGNEGANTVIGGNGYVTVSMAQGGLIDVQSGTLVGSSSDQGSFYGNQASLNVAAGATFNGVEGNIAVDALTGAGSVLGGYYGGGSLAVGVAGGSGTFTGTIGENNTGPWYLYKEGAGTQTLTGTNSYTGNTVIDGGTLALAGTGSIATSYVEDYATFDIAGLTNGGTSVVGLYGNGTITLGGNTLALTGGNISDFAGVASGTGGLTVQGGGTLLLSGANSYTGTTTVDAATLRFGADDVLANSSTVTVLNGGTVDLNGRSDTVATVNLTGTLTGGGLLTAATYNVYAGSTINNGLGGGTLNIYGDTALNGTTDATPVNVFAGTLTLGSAERLNDLATVRIAAPGALKLGGAETIGSLSDLNGTGGSVDLAGSLLTVGGDGTNTTFSGTIGNSGPRTGLQYVGSWSVGDGPDWETNPAVYSGQDTAALLFGGNAGSYSISTISNDPSQINHLAFVDGWGDDQYLFSPTSESFSYDAGNPGYNDPSGTGSSYSAYVNDHSSPGEYINYAFVNATGIDLNGLTKVGTGTLTLTGANTYTGLTTIDGGTLALGGGQAIADGNTVLVNSGGTLALLTGERIGSLTGSGTVTLGANTLFLGTNDASSSFSGVISGSGGLAKTGTGSLTLSGANTFTGTTYIAGGNLIFGASNVLADASTLSLSGATADLGANSDTIATLIMSNATLNGTGTLTASQYSLQNATINANTGTGYLYTAQNNVNSVLNGTIGASVVEVSGGTLTLGASDRLADTAALYVDRGSVFDLAGFNETVGSLQLQGTLNGTGTLTAANYFLTAGTVNANLGTGAVYVSRDSFSNDTLTTLNGTAGATTVQVNTGATLALGASNRLADTAYTIVSTGGTLNLGAFSDTVGTLFVAGALNGSGLLTANQYQLSGGTVNANLGAGTLFQLGGNSVLNGTAAATTVSVQGGTLLLGASDRLADTATVAISTGATLNLGANSDTVGLLQSRGTLSGTGTLTATQYQLTGATVSANLGAGALFQLGGTSVLNGTAAAAPVMIDAGTLVLGASDRLADSATVSIANGAVLDLGGFSDSVASVSGTGTLALRAGALTVGNTNADFGFGGAVTGTGDLTKVGTGTFTVLSNASTTARLNANAGNLLFAGTSSGSARIQGGTLSGGGSFTGNLLLASGTLSPGMAGQAIAGFNVGSFTATGGTYAVDFSGIAGGFTSDQVIATGAVTLSGGIVAPTATAPATNYNASQDYLILKGTSLSGTFGNGATFGQVSGTPDLYWRLRYDLSTSGVVLEIRKTIDYAAGLGAGATPNQVSVATALTGSTLAGSDAWVGVLNTIGNLSPADRIKAYDSIGGEALADVTTSVGLQGNRFTDLLRSRFANGGVNNGDISTAVAIIDGTATTGAIRAAQPTEGGSSLAKSNGVNAWIQGFGADGSIGSRFGSEKVDDFAAGVAVGLELKSDSLTIGAAGAVSDLEGNVRTRLSSNKATLYQGGVYVAYDDGVSYANVSGSYFGGTIDTARTVSLGGSIVGKAIGQAKTSGYAGGATLGRRIGLGGNMFFTPQLGGNVVSVTRNAFTESGVGVLSLAVNREQRTLYSATGDARLSYRGVTGNGGVVEPYVSAGVRVNFGDLDTLSSMRFSGAPAGTGAFTIAGARMPKTSAVLGAGLTANPSDTVSIGVDLGAALGARYQEGRVGLHLKIGF